MREMPMSEASRARFDSQLEWVLDRLPERARDLLEEIPLHVEDYPSARIVAEMKLRSAEELCGLYVGTPIDERSVASHVPMPDVIMLYRRGVLAASRDAHGRVTRERLREQIRITILHELAHHHGIDEEELGKLGYG